MAGLRAYVQNCFSLDLRGLALMRICLGLSMLYDVFDRWFNAEAFYSASGFAPADEVIKGQAQFSFSVLYLFDSLPALHVFFSLYLLLVIGFLLGLKARWCTGFLWLIVQSLYYRNELVSYGLDNFLICFLTIGFFLPLDHRWSISGNREKIRSNITFSWATAALVLQVVTIYTNAAYHKLSDPIWRSGQAVYNALVLQPRSQPEWILESGLSPWLSYFVIIAQLSILVVFLFPAKRSLRLVPLILIASMHLGMLLFMDLGALPLAGLAAAASLFIGTESLANTEARSNSWSTLKIVPMVLVILLLIHNVQLLGKPIFDRSPSMLGPMSIFLKHQQWVFYAPVPEHTFWFVLRGQGQQGEDLDLISNQPFAGFQRKLDVSQFGDIRWPIFLRQMESQGGLARPFADYVCRAFEGLRSFEFYHMSEKINIGEGAGKNEPQKKLVFNYVCRV